MTALILAPVERAGRPADDPVPVEGHPQLEPGMAGILLRSRPHVRPVRAAVGTDADQVESLPAFPGLRCRVVLEQDKRGPVRAGESGPDVLRGLGDPGGGAGLGDHGQVAGLRIRGEPPAEVGNARPGRAGWIPPERLVGDQIL